jgi:hypothetical protein
MVNTLGTAYSANVFGTLALVQAVMEMPSKLTFGALWPTVYNYIANQSWTLPFNTTDLVQNVLSLNQNVTAGSALAVLDTIAAILTTQAGDTLCAPLSAFYYRDATTYPVVAPAGSKAAGNYAGIQARLVSMLRVNPQIMGQLIQLVYSMLPRGADLWHAVHDAIFYQVDATGNPLNNCAAMISSDKLAALKTGSGTYLFSPDMSPFTDEANYLACNMLSLYAQQSVYGLKDLTSTATNLNLSDQQTILAYYNQHPTTYLQNVQQWEPLAEIARAYPTMNTVNQTTFGKYTTLITDFWKWSQSGPPTDADWQNYANWVQQDIARMINRLSTGTGSACSDGSENAACIANITAQMSNVMAEWGLS